MRESPFWESSAVLAVAPVRGFPGLCRSARPLAQSGYSAPIPNLSAIPGGGDREDIKQVCTFGSPSTARRPPVEHRMQEAQLRLPYGSPYQDPGATSHRMAIGLTGEPVASGSLNGAITQRNDHRPSVSQ